MLACTASISLTTFPTTPPSSTASPQQVREYVGITASSPSQRFQSQPARGLSWEASRAADISTAEVFKNEQHSTCLQQISPTSWILRISYRHISVYPYIHVYLYPYIRVYIHTFIYTCMYAYTDIHIYTHTFMYTYTCIYAYIHIRLPGAHGESYNKHESCLLHIYIRAIAICAYMHTQIYVHLERLANAALARCCKISSAHDVTDGALELVI